MSIARNIMSAAVLALVAAACGDDPVEPGDELTEKEAVALLRGTGDVLFADVGVIHSSEDSVVFRCSRSGRITAVGKLPDEEFVGDTVRLVIDYRMTPSGCGVTNDGVQLTIEGNPSFRYQFAYESIGSTREYDITGSFSGGVKWKLADRSGNCAVDLTLAGAEPVGETVKGSFDGKLCGHDVKVDATGLVPPDL